MIPIAIIVGFSIIAVAIFLSGGRQPAVTQNQPTPATRAEATAPIRMVDETDFIRGNPNATIMIVEYSDYECPFCKQYHTIMRQIIDEYGASGRVGWVYRQLPVPQLHPNAPRISEAALCVGDLGGNAAFWEFSDIIFDSRGLQDVVNITRLPEFAEQAGVSRRDFNACMDDGRMRPAVESSMREAFEAGIRVTPYTVVMVGTDVDIIEGVVSYDILKGVIEDLLQQLDGGTASLPATEPIEPAE